MKTSVTTSNSKRDEKKQVNITWNSRLIFQIGVIASCLIVFFLMQLSFKPSNSAINEAKQYDLEELPFVNYELEEKLPDPVKAPLKKPEIRIAAKKPVVSPTKISVQDNTSKDAETPVEDTQVAVDEPAAQTSVALEKNAENDMPTGPSNIINVEFVPVFPGCESLSSNAEKIECMSSRINSFINRNFRKEILGNMDPNQTQRIYVQFKIDVQGFIKDVKANSTDEKLKNEATRVISHLPKMKPGRQGDKNVEVLYTVPIVFQVQ